MWRMLLIALCVAPAAYARPAPMPPAHVLWMAPLGVHRLPERVLAPGLTRAPQWRPATLEHARMRHIRRLIRRHPARIAPGPLGNPIVRHQVLAVNPSLRSMRRALAAGFSLAQSRPLRSLGIHLVLLHTPRGLPAIQALARLHRIDPGGLYALNQLYTDTGTVNAEPGPGPGADRGSDPARSSRIPRAARDVVVGLIGGGIEVSHPAFRDARIYQHGCDGVSVPSAHGTAIASLLIGRDGHFAGAIPGATLFAANVFCGKPTGGSVSAIAAAFAWLVRRHVPVIDISVVGPPNALLREVIEHVRARGILVVAAVGDDGPTAPPLYPAAYPSVIGVTAVDIDRRVLLAAERGPQVMFAAPGVDIEAARLPRGYTAVRGTSFAVPWVAGLLAKHLRAPGAAAARAALASVIHQAVQLGLPGRNPIVGYGLIGAGLARPW